MKLMVGTVLAVGLVLGGAATASATTGTSTPAPGPVTITLSPEQVQNLCDKRLPKIEQRTTRLLDRIQGDASVRGSVQWLKARAAKERDAGRETSAQLLEERADRRGGRVDQLNQIKQWASDFQSQHCGSK
jgi:propanediol dehydratase small subunit